MSDDLLDTQETCSSNIDAAAKSQITNSKIACVHDSYWSVKEDKYPLLKFSYKNGKYALACLL